MSVDYRDFSSIEVPSARLELLGILYAQVPLIVVGSIVLALANLAAYSNKLPITDLMIYAIAVAVVAIIRIGLYLVYRATRFRRITERGWRCLIMLFSFINGVIWCAWSLYIASSLSPPEMLVMLVIQSGICAGTVSTSSASRGALALFVVPALLPLAIFESSRQSLEGSILAAVIVIYLLLILSSAQRIYKTLHDSIVLAGRNRLLVDELYRHSNTDGLTGIANRRSFDHDLNTLWEMSHVNSQPLSLLMFDVDFFKAYNDYYGHLAGDECLQAIAASVEQMFLQDGYHVARYGGEEFCVLLINTPAEQAQQLGEALRRHIFDMELPHARSLTWERVTISVGVATRIPARQGDQAELIGAADKGLYMAKRLGRNRVCLFTGEQEVDSDASLPPDVDCSSQL